MPHDATWCHTPFSGFRVFLKAKRKGQPSSDGCPFSLSQNGETSSAGTGKSWLGTALGHQACMNGYKVAYYNLYRLFEEIALARISSTLHRFFAKLAQTDLLILDDFGMRVLDGQQLLDFMEIIEDRHGQNATIMISQLPVSDWYEVMRGNTTAADAILDRLVHTSVRFELKGASLRQKRMSNSTESEKDD